MHKEVAEDLLRLITEALEIADAHRLSDVAISLNDALVRMGSEGKAPPDPEVGVAEHSLDEKPTK